MVENGFSNNIRLTKQSRNIYISWKWVKVQKLAQTAKIFEMTNGVRREGQAEFFSHHAQSLHMGPKDNAMTRYWQY